MSAASRHLVRDQSAFVLHSHPFRETSLIVEIFTRELGRQVIVARGARRPRSALRGVLMNFQPLSLSWFGKGEVKTLHGGEWQGGQPQLQSTALMCGFYLNELLLNLLTRDDPHPALFDYYRATLYRLAHEADHAATLRCFEKHLLQELGYGLQLEKTVDGSDIYPQVGYQYVLEHGAILARDTTEGMSVIGQTLLDMARDDYSDGTTMQQSKALMRVALNHYLAGKSLHTRELIKELQRPVSNIRGR